MKRIWIAVALLTLVLATLLSACGGGATTTTTTTSPTSTSSPTTTTSTSTPTTTTTTSEPAVDMYGGTFVQSLTVGPATPLGYPPEGAPDATSLARHSLEALLSVDRSGTLHPILATSWDVDIAALTMTFQIRQGVKFHDGADLDAHDVVLCFQAYIDLEKAPEWESVTALDDYTVQVKVVRYTNITLTGMGGFLVWNPDNVDTQGLDWVRANPIGTGPFKFVEYERDSRLVFERNENYWDPELPYLDGLEFIVIADETVRKLAFQRGDLHLLRAAGIDAQELEAEGYFVNVQTGGTLVLIPDSANADSPFSDIRVREAVSYAIDREALVEGLGFGFTNPAYSLFPGWVYGKIDNVKINKYDPEKARQLLTDAGYPNGFSITIHTFTRIVPREYINAIASMLGEVGIDVTPDFPEAGKYTEYRFNGWSNGMMAHGYAAFDNANSLWSFYFTSTAFPSFERPQALLDAIDASLAAPEFSPEAFETTLRIIDEDTTVIPYIEEVVLTFYQSGVHDPGIENYAATVFMSRFAWLEPEAR